MTDKLHSAVLDLDRAWEDAIVRADADALQRLASADLVYTHAGGWAEGRDGFVDHIVNGELRYVSVRYEDIKVVGRNEAAVITCALHLQTATHGGDRGELHFRSTHVWALEEGDWRLLAVQSTHLRSQET